MGGVLISKILFISDLKFIERYSVFVVKKEKSSDKSCDGIYICV